MKQVGILGGLLAVTLIGSYMAWTADDSGTVEAGSDAAMVYNAKASDLTGLVWKSEKLTVSLERKSDERGDYTWVSVSEQVEIPAEPVPEPEVPEPIEGEEGTSEPADGEEPAEPEEPPTPAEPEYETTTTVFLGNKAAGELWDKFAPLMALRKLDDVDSTSAVFGFEDSTTSLDIARRSGPLSLVVGGETYGTKDRYIQSEGSVFLLDDATLRPLEFGKTRLVERNLVPVKSKDTLKVGVKAGATSVAFSHQNKDDPAAAFWAREDSPKTADDAAGDWIDKLFRMRVQNYEDSEIAATLEPVLTYTIATNSEVWTVEVLRETNAISPEFYARTEYNRSLVKLTKSLAGEVVADVDIVLGAPPEGDDEQAP